MPNYTEIIPLPTPNQMNTGLSAAEVSTLIHVFGDFPDLPENCGDCRNPKIAAMLETRDVGPFRCTAINRFLDVLQVVFDNIKRDNPALYALIGTEGAMCYRYVRGYPGQPSNHAAGTAVDLSIGGICPDLGDTSAPAGLQAVYPFMHEQRLFWGAGYHNGRPDSMHWEASNELLLDWKAKGMV